MADHHTSTLIGISSFPPHVYTQYGNHPHQHHPCISQSAVVELLRCTICTCEGTLGRKKKVHVFIRLQKFKNLKIKFQPQCTSGLVPLV